MIKLKTPAPRTHDPRKHDPRAARLRAVQQRIRQAGVDALLISNPVDIRYLTGFIGEDSAAMVPARGAAVIITDSRFEEQVKHEAPGVRAIIRKKGMYEAVAKFANARGRQYEKIGVQSDYVTLSARKGLVKQLGSAGRVKAVDDGLIRQRAIKDVGEVDAIRQAVKIQQQAFCEMCQELEPGMSEERACAFLEYRMRYLGADGPGFPSIVAADANAALPHAIPGKTKLRKGGILLVDWGACYQGYRSDMTRVVGIGGMSRKMREVYKIVLEAQLAGIAAIGPGVELKAVDAAARNVIKKAGYDKQFGHGLGHGIGLNIHEEPRFAKTSKGVAEVGQVVTVEPGIYLPGVGGVRLEDDVLVTETGHEVLCDLPKDLESAII